MIRAVWRQLRGFGAALLGVTFGGRLIAGPARPRPSPIKRILIIRIDERVGNLLLTTPLIGALQRAFPEAELDVLVARAKSDILRGIARTLPFEKRSLWRRPWTFASEMRRLRQAKYDVAIDASHAHAFSLTSALLLAWTRAPIRITHARGAAPRFATTAVRIDDPSAIGEVATKLRLAEPLGVDGAGSGMRTNLGLSPAREGIDAWIASLPENSAPIAILPGARKLDHRTAPELFGMLASLAADRGLTPIIVWGPGERELAEGIAKNFAGHLAPPTDLEELAALLRRCRLAVVNDSGPMHLAVACGTPTLALFRGSDPKRWGHRGPEHSVVDIDAYEGDALRSALSDAFLSIVAD